MQALNNNVIISETVTHKFVENALPVKTPSLEIVSIGEAAEDRGFKVGDNVLIDEFQGDRRKIKGQEFIIVKAEQIRVKL
ncbi:MAG: hypothetical protein ACOH18_05460 [Candidatus Saccharimonadaceae bacterium]